MTRDEWNRNHQADRRKMLCALRREKRLGRHENAAVIESLIKAWDKINKVGGPRK